MKNYELTENIGIQLGIARTNANMSQKQLAKRVGISTKTLQNWESGYSTPSFDDIIELFRAMGLNPLPYFESLLYPGVFKDSTPDTMLEHCIKELSENEKRGLAFILRGDHGSSAYCVLQLMIAYLHLPLIYRQMICTSIKNAYEINNEINALNCEENIAPDVEALTKALKEATAAVHNGQYGYI